MKKFDWFVKILLNFSCVLLSFLNCSSVLAYYDDTHFSFTYYLARCVGYTPLQAHRIASANVMVDEEFNTATEPVQHKKLHGRAQEPRVKFHAFIDERKYNKPGRFFNSDKKTYEAGLKDVDAQLEVLWQDALKHKNPGVYLHAYQDSFAHHGYGSKYGHWKPGLLDNTYLSKFYRKWEKEHPPGHFTDYLSWDPPNDGNTPSTKRNFWMATKTTTKLLKYMNEVCPAQFKHARIPKYGVRANEINKTTQALRAANSFDRRSYVVDAEEGVDLIPPSAADTDMKKANAAVRVALSKWGELKRFQSIPQRIIITKEGRPKYLTEWKIWVTMSVELKNLSKEVVVKLIMPKTRKNDKSYTIYKKTCTASNPVATFKNVPIGDVRIKVRDAKTRKSLITATRKISRDKQKVSFSFQKNTQEREPVAKSNSLLGLWSGTMKETVRYNGKKISETTNSAKFRITFNGSSGYRIKADSPYMKGVLPKSIPLTRKTVSAKKGIERLTPRKGARTTLNFLSYHKKKGKIIYYDRSRLGDHKFFIRGGVFEKK